MRLVLGEWTSGQMGLSWSRSTARYEPQRRVTAAAATPSRPTIERWPGLGVRRGPRMHQHQHVEQERMLVLVERSGERGSLNTRDGVEAALPCAANASGTLRRSGRGEHLALLGQDDKLLGEHTHEVLAEIGVEREEEARLRAAGVVG